VNEQENNLVFYETLVTIFWLLVDFFYIWELKIPLLFVAIPTIIFISLVLYKYSENLPMFLANCVMLGWGLMSVFWALDDLWHVPGALTFARCFVSFSVIILVLFLIMGDFRREAVKRLRRIRVLKN